MMHHFLLDFLKAKPFNSPFAEPASVRRGAHGGQFNYDQSVG